MRLGCNGTCNENNCGCYADWYVVEHEPGRLRLFRQQLEDRGGRCFVPKRMERRHVPHDRSRKGQLKRSLKVEVEVMMLPGYVFVQATDDHGMSIVQNTPGYGAVLRGASEHPLRMPGVIMKEIEAKCDDVYDAIIGAPVFEIGELVTLLDGPMRTYGGAVEEVEGETLKILVDMFGRFVPVSASSQNVARQQ